MYREGYEAALEELEKHKKRVAEKARGLDDEVRDEMPTKILEELERLRGELSPAEKTVEAVRACEESLSTYETKLRDALNIAAQIRSAKARGEKIRFTVDGVPLFKANRLKRVLQVAGVGLLALMFTFVPGWLIESAEDGAGDCFAELHDTGKGDPTGCYQRAQLLWPLAVPWKHEEAWKVWKRIDRRVAEELRSRSIDPAGRAESAKERLEEDPLWAARELADEGAFDVLAASDCRQPQALHAAAVLADLEAVKRHALAIDGATAEAGANQARGAWLCLLGEQEAGLAALARADEQSMSANGVADGDVRLAMVACGASREQLGSYDVNDYSREAMTFLRLSDPGWQKGRRQAVVRSVRDHVEGATVAAVALTAEGEMTWRDALAWVAPESIGPQSVGPPRHALDPWELQSPVSFANKGGAAASAYAEAARRLTELASNAPEEKEKEDVFRPMDSRANDAARNAPRETLRLAAWYLGWHAAVQHARWGKREAALAQLEAIRGQAPAGELWKTAAVHIAVRDHEGALEKLEAAVDPARMQPGDEHFRALNRAYALAGLGRFDEAHGAAKTAYELMEGEGASAAMLTAMALITGKPAPLQPAAPVWDGSLSYQAGLKLDWVAAWLGLAEMKDEDRAVWRAKITSHTISSHYAGAPAAVFLVGRAVDDPALVEPWLDRVLSSWHLRGRRAAVAQARAEAARWRGDEEAAKMWQKRADVLLGLADGYRKGVLMRSARKQ